MGNQSRKSCLWGPIITWAAIALLASACGVDPATRIDPPEAGPPEHDTYGGLMSVSVEATGHWRTEQIDGVWWFVTPEGHGFFSAGVNNVDSHADYAPALQNRPYHVAVLTKYGTREAWADTTFERLRQWGFNTIGAWSRQGNFESRMPFTPVWGFSSLAPKIPNSTGSGPFAKFARPLRDYFDLRFVDGAADYATGKAHEWSGNPYFLGVFTDNELPWGLSAIQGMSYIDAYISLPAGAPGKLELQRFFEERYGNRIHDLNLTWRLRLTDFDQLQDTAGLSRRFILGTEKQNADRIAFRDRVATQYYRVVDEALHAADPHLLNLGSRFVSILTAPGVIEIAGDYVDVVSVNSYQFTRMVGPTMSLFYGREGFLFGANPWDDLGQVYRLTGKPIMITEYSFRAVVPDGPPSDQPPGYLTFETQQQRADHYSHYMNELYDRPYVIGAHWFEYCDQPATGRGGDGENNNFGTVNVRDEVYVELTDAMQAMNHAVRVREGPHPVRR